MIAAYVLPGWVDAILPLGLLVGAIGGLAALVAPPGRLHRTPRVDLAYALLLLCGIAYSIAHAGAEDRYFGPNAETFWEWGGISRVPMIVGLAAAVLALALLALSRWASPMSPRLHRVALVAAGAASGLLCVGVIALSIGH